MKPLTDYIFIAVDKPDEVVSSSGIILTPNVLEQQGAATGEITALGPLVKGVKVGDKVVFNEHQYDHLFSDKETKKKVMVGKLAGIYATYD